MNVPWTKAYAPQKPQERQSLLMMPLPNQLDVAAMHVPAAGIAAIRRAAENPAVAIDE